MNISGLVLDTALWNGLPSEEDGALENSEKSNQPDSTYFVSLRDKDPVLVQLQPASGYEVVAESETLFWNTQGIFIFQLSTANLMGAEGRGTFFTYNSCNLRANFLAYILQDLIM
jgi:hypothetical protein